MHLLSLTLIVNVYRGIQYYNGTSNSGHFRGPSLVAVALEVTVVGRFYYMYIFY